MLIYINGAIWSEEVFTVCLLLWWIGKNSSILLIINVLPAHIRNRERRLFFVRMLIVSAVAAKLYSYSFVHFSASLQHRNSLFQSFYNHHRRMNQKFWNIQGEVAEREREIYIFLISPKFWIDWSKFACVRLTTVIHILLTATEIEFSGTIYKNGASQSRLPNIIKSKNFVFWLFLFITIRPVAANIKDSLTAEYNFLTFHCYNSNDLFYSSIAWL